MSLRQFIMIISCSVSLLFLSGCWDAQNLEENYFINALGIDYKQDEEKFIIYVQIVNFQAMSGGGEARGMPTGSLSYVGVAKGKTIIDAVHELYHQSERLISWDHLSAIIFTKEALQTEKAIINTFDTLGRYHETRNTMWIFATQSPITDLLTTFPRLHLSVILSSFGEPMQGYQQSSFVSPIRLHRFLSIVNEPGRTVVFPIINIQEGIWFEEGGKAQKNLGIAGAAVVQDFNFKSFLLGQDMLGIRWSQASTVRTPVTFGNDQEALGTVTVYFPKFKVKPEIKEDGVTFNIDLTVDAHIAELGENMTIETITKDVAQHIRGEIRHTFEKGLDLDADVLQLGHSLYRKNPKLWHKHSQEGEFPLTKESLGDINIKVKVTQTGRDKLRTVSKQKQPLNYWKLNEK